MRWKGKVPTTHLERVELKHDFIENVILSTAAKLARSLKMSSVGDQLQDRLHIYVQDWKRTIRPIKFWSQEFPDATEIDELCRLKVIFVTPDCYVDEEKNFALIADADFIEVVARHRRPLPPQVLLMQRPKLPLQFQCLLFLWSEFLSNS
jgi:hypothetical protein